MSGFLQFKDFLKSRRAALLVTLLSLIFSYVSKTPCQRYAWDQPLQPQYRYLCYNDAQALYHHRGLDKKQFPYTSRGTFEYPPLIGLQMWLASLVSQRHESFFVVNAVINAIFALLTLFLLYSLTCTSPYRIYFYAIAPPLFIHTYINWDISTVFFTTLAIWAWTRGLVFWCALALGVGLSGKLYPLFAVGPLALAILTNESQRGRRILNFILGLVAGVLLLNLPILLADYLKNGDINGWLRIFTFHSQRWADFGSLWYWIFQALAIDAYHVSSKALIDWTSLGFLLSGYGFLLWQQYKRNLNPWQGFAAALCLCLLLSKVHSPQYSLWLLPFLTVLRVPTKAAIFYFFADAVIFFTGLYWFLYKGTAVEWIWEGTFAASVWLRAAALMWLGLAFMRPSSQLTFTDQK